jgi:hypothetical protein
MTSLVPSDPLVTSGILSFLGNQNYNESSNNTSIGLRHGVLFFVVIVLVVITIVVLVCIVKRHSSIAGSSSILKGASLLMSNSSNTNTTLYGSYSTPVETPCLTSSGLCTDDGYKTITQTCVPNPTTGYGCLTADGTETFATLVQKVGCQPQCRQFIWDDVTPVTQTCTVASPYNNQAIYPCLPNGITGNKLRTLTCVPNDGYGINACTYLCGSTPNDDVPTSSSYMPICQQQGPGTLVTMRTFNYEGLSTLPMAPGTASQTTGLRLSKGYTITNQLGNDLYTITPSYNGSTQISLTGIQSLDQQISLMTSCNDTGVPSCGIWAVSDSTNTTTSPCRYQTTPAYTSDCNTGTNTVLTSGLYDPTLLFDFGYLSTPMKCITSGTNTSGTCLSLTTEGVPCAADFSQVNTMIPNNVNPSSVLVCKDPSNSNVPGCVQPCIFVAPTNQLDLSSWNAQYHNLIGSYLTISIPNATQSSGSNFLTLRHVPCSTITTDALDSNRKPSDAVFYDCTGNPTKSLVSVRTMLAYSGGDQNGAYWDKAWCTSDQIVNMNSLLVMIKPVKPTSASGLDCNIIGILGKRYIGWLDLEVGPDGLTYLVWKQAKSGPTSNFGDLPVSPRFTISASSATTYNINPYNQSTAIYSDSYGAAAQILTSLNFNIQDMTNVDTYLFSREDRCQVNSCSLQFDYIPHLC